MPSYLTERNVKAEKGLVAQPVVFYTSSNKLYSQLKKTFRY